MPDPRALEPIRPDPRGAHLRLHPDQLAALPEHDYDKKLDEMHAALALLVQHARAQKRNQFINGLASGQTNGSGNLTLPVYQVGQGFLLGIGRLVIEAATFDATSPRTPAAPFAAAAAWLGVFQSIDPTSVAQGQMLDFMPTQAGAPILPVVGDYSGASAGPFVQGGHWLVLKVVSGPASQRITVRYQGLLQGEQV